MDGGKRNLKVTDLPRRWSKYVRDGQRLLAIFGDREATGDATVAAGFAARALSIDDGTAGIEVNHKTPAADAVAALVEFNITHHGDEPAIQIIDRKVAARRFRVAADEDAT